uniref:Docking protein 2 n=1 Tax=Sphaeramia orbicularis TaxID=375764 RepID=A0A672YMI8_9TELE
MNWVEPAVKRGSLHRGTRVDEDQGMEDNSLYSGRDTVRVFRVCIRRTEASDRCHLKGDVILRADVDALHLLDRGGDVVYTWPYRYLRRFGRDKSTFSFEAGRRCESGEGSFEFDTKQGNVLFQVVEANINLQRTSHPLRQTSGGGPEVLDTPHLPLTPPLLQTRTPPLPHPRSHIPQAPAAQEVDGVYSTVNDATLLISHHKDTEGSALLPQQQQQQPRPHMSRLEPPVDKALTGVRSLTLDARGLPVPCKNRVKTISSCPLPHAGPDPAPNPAPNPGPAHPILDQTYSQINLVPGIDRGTRRDKRGGASAPPPPPPPVGQESEYSLPFDLIASAVMADLLKPPQAPPHRRGRCRPALRQHRRDENQKRVPERSGRHRCHIQEGGAHL